MKKTEQEEERKGYNDEGGSEEKGDGSEGVRK